MKKEPATSNIKQQLYPLARSLRKAHRRYLLNTDVLTPSNYQIERERFFGSRRYNPQFVYVQNENKPFTNDYEEFTERLSQIQLPSELAEYLRTYIDHTRLLAQTYSAIGTESFAKYASTLFGFGSIRTKTILDAVPKPILIPFRHHIIHNAEALKRIFIEHLIHATPISEALVEIDEYNNHTIRVTSKHLVIGSAVKRSEINLRRLIVHEIESHMLQRYNVLHMKNPLLRLVQFHESQLYAEGLAVYNEVLTNTMTKSAYENYLLRLRAVEHIDKSFREIYDILRGHGASEKKSYLITYRVKRGLPDTSKPGGFPKDASYLLGYKEVYDFIKRGGRYESLYLSRVPDLGQLLLKYNLLKPRHFYLPSFFDRLSSGRF